MWSRVLRSSSLAIGGVLIFSAGMALSASAAYGQQQKIAAAEYSDDTIERVAQVYVGIRDIRQKYRQKLQAVDDPSRAAPLQREQRIRIDKLLEKHDLTQERYNEITTAAQSNRELYTRLRKAIENVENR